jgi:glutamate synthase (NADPH/NADH) large chain
MIGRLPDKDGLYDPQWEHDSCGVGFVANLDGTKTHQIVKQGLKVLANLHHRGACGCDPETGDGAGILLQMPDDFLRKAIDPLPFDLPAFGEYGVGFLFMDHDSDRREWTTRLVEKTVKDEGQILLGWRDVPVDPDSIGFIARKGLPFFRQVFIKRNSAIKDVETFERKLYVIRKILENRTRQHPEKAGYFYVPSFSSKTLIYKGLLMAHQVDRFYADLSDESMTSGLALVHQRYSTNTFPTWDLAHPFRYLAHNGEINTLRGNINWMHARESQMRSDLLGEDLRKVFPITTPRASDSAILDNAFELLVLAGRPLHHAILFLIPEAWSGHESMSQEKKDFYEYHSCLMEPWDGPASIAFTDGRRIGAVLDRNGLRPSRFTVTNDGFVVMASETGVLELDQANVKQKGRLQPGRMFLIDTEQGRIIEDEEIKHELASRKPYGEWLRSQRVTMEQIPAPPYANGETSEKLPLLRRQQIFGYTDEDLKVLLAPMAQTGEEPISSMGNDTPLAVLSDRPQLLYSYFKQLFAQVTNPPIDPIREALVMSLETYIGSEQNLLDETPEHARQLKLHQPILTNQELDKIRNIEATGKIKSITLKALYKVSEGEAGLRDAMEQLCMQASQAIEEGYAILILSDRGVDQEWAPIPTLLACSGVHHHLVREGTRTRAGLVIESGEPREVMHFALLTGYGAGAINPYVAFETITELVENGKVEGEDDADHAIRMYIKAINKGLLKVFSKMGISTLQSYRGAQIFEAVGIGRDVIDQYFTNTTSRIGGIGLDIIARESALRHGFAFSPIPGINDDLPVGGYYHWRRFGEHHMVNPDMVAKLQHSVRINSYATFKEYSSIVNNENQKRATIRGLLDFNFAREPVPLDEVEPASEIVKRFCTGAMSFGSISREAHENLALAMNRLGGKSNTGEGGEDPERFKPLENGDSKRSAIKQVASGRFGVTIEYLTNADQLQIKMAQGAKPGEGGQLPGHKVDEVIARVRHSTPGVTLISPPPHHDIYSIEDLAQLIHDLKNANPRARVSVKLVAEVGVGTVAAGVSKGHSDHVLISGHDGGTGASPVSSIKHAGLPWELGLSETQQVLVKNDLRGRIIVETDGQLKTGRDVVVAAILGAEEFGFATAPLIASGCIMMRKCHLNTCPVGVATQDPVLRRKFDGKPEYVVNFFFFVAEEVRELMAKLGVRKVDDLVGRFEYLRPANNVTHWKAKTLDLSAILKKPDVPDTVAIRNVQKQDHGLEQALDQVLIEKAKPALEHKQPVNIEMPIYNINRTVGTMLSHEIAKRHGLAGLPDDTIRVHFKGSAGQSFACFLANGVSFTLEGDANDYTCKGMSGGRVVVYPPREASFVPENNMIVGNVVLYGATNGECYFRGMAGERFCVRNSGARAVVEGVGDHGCEYMTGGRVVVLGKTGRNFAAGMSGGIAYVYDEDGTFERRCNLSMVDLEPVIEPEAVQELQEMIQHHVTYTESTVGQRILADWDESLSRFVRVMPKEYRRYLLEKAVQAAEQEESLELTEVSHG